MEHMVRRGATYHYRRRIPTDLVHALNGKREVTFSLQTKDRREAAAAARRASVRLDEEWSALRRDDEDRLAPERASEEQAERAEVETEQLIAALRALTSAAPTKADPKPPKAKAVTLEALIEHWKRERRLAPKTVRACEVAAIEFDNLHKEPAVQAITRPMVIAYRDWLLKQGKSVKTINDGRLAFIRLLLGVARDRGLVAVNHAEDASLPEDKRAPKARLPYTPEQVQTIMRGTEQFKGAHPARYWLPRLARWTGARVNELHQLRRCDLVERDGYRGVLITNDGEHDEETGTAMRTKTAGSVRWVPLHAEVAGFWDWAQGREDGPLFPANANKFGIVSDAFVKWYGRQRPTWGIKDRRYVFHSWRHLFADQCRAAGVAPEVRMALMGHAEGGAAGAYGVGELPPKVLAAALSKLNLAPLDLRPRR